MFTFSFITNGHIFYALPFLELFPDYNCPSDITVCDHVAKCNDPRVTVNWDSTRSLHNWVDKLGLECNLHTSLMGII